MNANASLDHETYVPSVDPVLRRVAEALRGIRFGQVTIIVQDGHVVQVDRTEKQRFTRPDKS